MYWHSSARLAEPYCGSWDSSLRWYSATDSHTGLSSPFRIHKSSVSACSYVLHMRFAIPPCSWCFYWLVQRCPTSILSSFDLEEHTNKSGLVLSYEVSAFLQPTWALLAPDHYISYTLSRAIPLISFTLRGDFTFHTVSSYNNAVVVPVTEYFLEILPWNTSNFAVVS